MKRKLFKIAWSIVDQFESFAESLKHAWSVIKLMRKLNSRAAVSFTYVKIEGEIREAVGTIAAAPGTGDPVSPKYDILRYWDVLANGWRSCRISNIMFN